MIKLKGKLRYLALLTILGPALLSVSANAQESDQPEVTEKAPVEKTATEASSTDTKTESKEKKEKEKEKSKSRTSSKKKNQKSNLSDLIHNDTFFGEEATDKFVNQTDSIYRGLENSKNPAQYIIDNDVSQFLSESQSTIMSRESELPIYAQELINEANIGNSNQGMLLNSVVESLKNQLKKRQHALDKLQTLVDSIQDGDAARTFESEEILNWCIIGFFVLVLIGVVILLVKRKGKGVKKTAPVRSSGSPVQAASADSGNGDIVVRRRTTSILKRQYIDDVKANPEYLLINSADFTNDSAVRNIYIKNSCLKEVYDLYAEDLRNSENPKEDGCMVLGRWVKDDREGVYDITLEDVVFPGDDAVFKEYELNFGGKIKLRIAEKLRRLRKETDLQYDLVCWIHSHPGLGVFFSNSDSNVQTQLKHSQHPNFLIAMVVDILTSDQETGIFTFRKDGTMNSKADLKKLYSLEEMYKWALESEKKSFNPGDYYNILSNALSRGKECNGVYLNNSSIIDLCQISDHSDSGIAGWVVGTKVDSEDKREFIVKSVVRDSDKPASGIIGVLVNLTHMSLPTLSRLLPDYLPQLSFVMVYTPEQQTVTTIPVTNGNLESDEQYYSEVTLDDLKIWTRRKR